METIKENSRKVYDKMVSMYRYTFAELQRFTRLESTELCLALAELQREGKIEQKREKGTGVYYARIPQPY